MAVRSRATPAPAGIRVEVASIYIEVDFRRRRRVTALFYSYRLRMHWDMIGKALNTVRRFNNISLREMAKRLGLSASYLSDIENENRRSNIDLIDGYAKVVGIPASHIILLSEAMDNVEASEAKAVQRWIVNIVDWLRDEKEEAKSV